ncbi:Rubredoxin [Tetrabaena socialis]|uniref:Rubredoxin n=1 Tax=Tetrabaena socialis TaxID=47790 RepID=A0A2J8AIX7_9CHLO|nr:Rubredoxin [Tetrabaena socialis]|eukprot:PNH12469.1 Rubredoxin [Tetrabaena socialis]
MQLTSRSSLCVRPVGRSRMAHSLALPRPALAGRDMRVRSTPEADTEFLTETERRKLEADKLRAAEKFMVIGSGGATCKSCGYEYKPEKGDPDFPVPPGMAFPSLPEDYICPTCGAPKAQFESNSKVVAGFAQNQGYGLGGNSMTEGQKSLLIYGALVLFFGLFIAGYALE